MRLGDVRRWAGVWGPAAFAGAAVAGGRRQPGYRHREHHISGLAARGTESAGCMIPGFLAFGLASLVLPIDDRAARRTLRLAGAATVVAGTCRCSTVECPAPFVDDAFEPTDARHAAASVVGFACWVALPVLGATRPGPRWYRRTAAGLALPTIAAWARAAAATRARTATRGRAQREFFTAVFGWYVATTVRALTERR